MLPIIISTLDNDLDRDFITWLYEEYEPLLFKVAQRFAPTHHDVEEIVQDSLERLIKKFSTIRHMERCILSAYIVSTVRNTSIEFLRKEKRRQARQRNYDDTSWTVEMQPQLALEELLLLAENRRELISAWGELPELDRALLEGKYFLGLSDAELAKQIGCQTSSIRMKLTRARRKALKSITDKEVERI